MFMLRRRLHSFAAIAMLSAYAHLPLQNVHAAGWGPMPVVNTEAYHLLDDTDESSDVKITFGSVLNKNLTYERSKERFHFDDDLYIQGNLSVLGTISGSTVHAEDALSSSGKLIIDQDQNDVAVIIESDALTEAGLRISMPSSNASANPHILFGYDNLFDANLFRNAHNSLTASSSLVIDPPGFNLVYRYDGSTYNDFTAEARTSRGNSQVGLSTEGSSNDELYLGLVDPFGVVSVDIDSDADGVTLSAQYWNGTWTTLNIGDGTNDLNTDGTISFSPPSDWAEVSINGSPVYYWIRLRSPSTNITSAPTIYSIAPTQDERLSVWSQAGDTDPALHIDHKQRIGVNTDTPTSSLSVNGSLTIDVTSVSATTTADESDTVLLVNANAGSRIINLPSASSALGRVYFIKKTDASVNSVTIDGAAGETIDGSTTKVLSTQYHAVKIISNGSNWFILSEVD